MAAGKWIGGVLGFITAGPLGALAGYALGSLFEHGLDAVNRDGDHHYNNAYDAYSGQQHNGRQGFGNQGYSRQQSYEGERNSFMFSLLVLSSYIINADGKIMHSEMEMVRRFLRQNFGEAASQQGEEILLMGLSAEDVDQMLNLESGASSTGSLDNAYRVLGISPDASNDEVKAAYRKMALKHHPDKVAALGEDVRRAAEKKFQEINDAKDRIYKARGL